MENITINTEVLKNLKPCTSRFKNWLEYYADFSGSFEEFIQLEKISYEDKVWVSRQLVPTKQLLTWAVLCAESVLHIFEAKYPNDKRVSDCIEFLKTDPEDKIQLLKYKNAAAAAYADAASAADAAAYATNAAAADAAADAAAAAYAAAYAAVDDRGEQKKKNIDLLIQVLKG